NGLSQTTVRLNPAKGQGSLKETLIKSGARLLWRGGSYLGGKLGAALPSSSSKNLGGVGSSLLDAGRELLHSKTMLTGARREIPDYLRRLFEELLIEEALKQQLKPRVEFPEIPVPARFIRQFSVGVGPQISVRTHGDPVLVNVINTYPSRITAEQGC